MTTADAKALLDALTDDQYEAAAAIAEQYWGVGPTALAEDNPEEVPELLQWAASKPEGI